MIRTVSAGVLAALAAMALAACGGPSGPRPVTPDEADRIAETLFTNWDSEGALVSVSTLLPDGTTLRLSGAIDFRNNVGVADVVTDTGAVTQVMWDETVVLENRPLFSFLAAEAGMGDFPWVARPPDPEFYDIDIVLAAIMGLGNVRRDNPELIRQDPGTQWLRSDILDGITVDVFAVGERSRMWITSGSSQLLRFESDNVAGTRPIVIDLAEPGPRTITVPDPSLVADAVVLRDLYEASGGTLPSWVSAAPGSSP